MTIHLTIKNEDQSKSVKLTFEHNLTDGQTWTPDPSAEKVLKPGEEVGNGSIYIHANRRIVATELP